MSRTTMSRSGRLTVPAEARHQLGLDDETEFDVEVDQEGDALVLRPAVLLRREDAWAYAAEHRARLDSAHDDVRDGRVRRLTEAELIALGSDEA